MARALTSAVTARGALMLALLAAGCDVDVGRLAVHLTRSWDRTQEPLERVAAFIRLRVDAPDLLVGPQTFAFGDRSGTLEIPIGSDRQLTVDGLGAEGAKVVARGRSAPLTISERDAELALYIGSLNKFSYTPNRMSQPRAFHTATLLVDGSVLLAGGTSGKWLPDGADAPTQVLRTVERLDGSSLTFESSTRTLEMDSARIGHSATLLPSGNVLIAGGSDGAIYAKVVEVYRPVERTLLKQAEELDPPRAWHAAALTDRGAALVGGVDTAGKVLQPSEAFDPGTGTMGSFPGLNTARRGVTLTRFSDGALLVIGGYDGEGHVLKTTELRTPGAPMWEAGPPLTYARAYHTATLLEDGTVLIVGGSTASGVATGVIERYDPPSRSFRLVPETDSLRWPRWGHTATLLSDGRVLVVGGFALGYPSPTVESIQLSTGDLTSVLVKQVGQLAQARAGHTATRLASGFVLVTGGLTAGSLVPLDTAELFVY
jgi:large repetitive protein